MSWVALEMWKGTHGPVVSVTPCSLMFGSLVRGSEGCNLDRQEHKLDNIPGVGSGYGFCLPFHSSKHRHHVRSVLTTSNSGVDWRRRLTFWGDWATAAIL